MNSRIKQWLEDHGKDDLFECTWAEIAEAHAYAGRSCPIAEYALGRDTASPKPEPQESDRVKVAKITKYLGIVGWSVPYWCVTSLCQKYKKVCSDCITDQILTALRKEPEKPAQLAHELHNQMVNLLPLLTELADRLEGK